MCVGVGGGGGGEDGMLIQSSHTGHIIFKRMYELPHLSWPTCVSFSTEFLKPFRQITQLPNFLYIFTSHSRCCQLDSTSADMCKSHPEAGPTQARIRVTCILKSLLYLAGLDSAYTNHEATAHLLGLLLLVSPRVSYVLLVPGSLTSC